MHTLGRQQHIGPNILGRQQHIGCIVTLGRQQHIGCNFLRTSTAHWL